MLLAAWSSLSIKCCLRNCTNITIKAASGKASMKAALPGRQYFRENDPIPILVYQRNFPLEPIICPKDTHTHTHPPPHTHTPTKLFFVCLLSSKEYSFWYIFFKCCKYLNKNVSWQTSLGLKIGTNGLKGDFFFFFFGSR